MTDQPVSRELAKAEEQDRMLVPLEEAPITMRTLQSLLATPTIPDRYKKSKTGLQDMYAAYLHGKEIGLGPMESIDKIVLINGQKSMYATTMSALIYRAGHELRVKVSPKSVTVTAMRRDPYSHELTEQGSWTFGEADAKKAYLDSKDTYENYPQLMWTWRAMSAVARIYFPDVLAGIGYTPEELGHDNMVEPIPDFVELEVNGEPIEMEQASATVEEGLNGKVRGERAINEKEEAARVAEAEVVDE